MALDYFPVLSLKEMSAIKIATAICNEKIRHVYHGKNDIFLYFCVKKNLDLLLSQNLGFCYRWGGERPLQSEETDFPIRRHGDALDAEVECECNMDLIEMFRNVWNEDGFSQNYLHYDSTTLKALMVQKIFPFTLPETLQNELLSFIVSAREEIEKWEVTHRKILFCSNVTSCFHECNFYWKSNGRINYQETAKYFIRNEILDIGQRYAIALSYNLREDAVSLWKKMTLNEKHSICSRYIWNHCLQRRDTIDCLADRTIRPHRSVRDNYYVWELHYTIGARTYFTNLSRGEKVEWLIYSIKNEIIDNEELLFCLAHLETNHEKENVFRECSCSILGYFLDRPLQSKFLEVADLLWKYLSGKMFFILLHFIIYDRIFREGNDFDYFQLLKDFWYRSPQHLKEIIKLKNIYRVIKLAISCDRITTFRNDDFVNICQIKELAFHFPGINSIS
ncbi:uncharacterized protein NPIL_318801 [Nephila pilipes]|uniref:Uncharacterized protein n=1 Tax=Nephila pilipes TaxID=299642 RepID=A0A8X6UV69_NEPPI|nr:uncharacterized protein NPIL_318801 [Nephila pilipes]